MTLRYTVDIVIDDETEAYSASVCNYAGVTTQVGGSDGFAKRVGQEIVHDAAECFASQQRIDGVVAAAEGQEGGIA